MIEGSSLIFRRDKTFPPKQSEQALRWLWSQADHSSLSSTKVTNEWIYTSLHKPIFLRSVFRDNFYFTVNHRPSYKANSPSAGQDIRHFTEAGPLPYLQQSDTDSYASQLNPVHAAS